MKLRLFIGCRRNFALQNLSFADFRYENRPEKFIFEKLKKPMHSAGIS